MSHRLLDGLVESHFRAGGELIAARLQAALALLERLREHPKLELSTHLSKGGQSLLSHERFGQSVTTRLALPSVNKNHGRRSSNLNAWGPALLRIVASLGFETATKEKRGEILDGLQDALAARLRSIVDEEPLQAVVKGRSGEAVIRDLLDAADKKGRGAAVAQYLVGAKLLLRFPAKSDRITISPWNKGDRSYHNDPDQRRADFDLGDFVFEVTVSSPDEKHLDQITSILEDADVHVWLLVRGDRLEFWKREVERLGVEHRRVTIASIELFIGQNLSELGDLTLSGVSKKFDELFEVYNEKWVAAVGTPGLRIVRKK